MALRGASKRITDRSSDRGASAVMVALSMFVMLGMGALALDLGNTYQERRTAQNAADQIAVSAAFTECSGGTPADVQAAADRAATANGYDFAGDVTLTKLGDGEYEAIVETDVATSFGKLLGTAQLGTGGLAVVSCKSGGGSGTTLHAHAGPECPGNELVVTGDSVEVNGGSHSNGFFDVPGDEVVLNDGATYVDDFDPNDDTVADPWFFSEASTRKWPYEWNIEDYEPDGSIASAADDDPADPDDFDYYHFHGSVGTLTLTEVSAGIHYVDGDLVLSADASTFIVNSVGGESGVTFVATGTITVIADTVHIEHYGKDAPGGDANNGLLMFSNAGDGACDDTIAINSQVDDSEYEGVLYAPNGKVDLKSNDSQSVAIWANFVKLTGDPEITLFFPEAVDLGPPKVVFEQ